MKFCPYCLRPHNERGRACSPECGRKVSNAVAAATSGRRRALSRLRDRRAAVLEHEQGWRDVAMGRKAPEEMFNLDKRKKVT